MRTRLTLLTIVLACAGSFIFAPSALAWFGRVQVEKVNQGGNPGDVFVFQPALTWTGEGSPVTSDFTLVGGQQSQPFDVACNAEFPNDVTCGPHFSNVSLKVGELPKPGYTLAGITCRYTQSYDVNDAFTAGPPAPTSPVKPANEVATDLANGTVDLKVHYNEWVLCTFTNVPTPALAPLPAPPPSPAPKVAVSPVHVKSGRASLVGPSKCVTSNVVVARVTGRQIARVTFYVHGQKVATLRRPNRGGKWVLSKRIHGLPKHGPYRVRARVEFTPSSQAKPKTLLMSIGRCRSGASAPKFTG
jgi:hypothetical protein